MHLHKLLYFLNLIVHSIRLNLFIKNNSIKSLPGFRVTTGVRIRATDGGNIFFGQKVYIDRFADISAKKGALIIGSRTFIGQFSLICACEKITIGSDCLIAEHVTIRDQNHNFKSNQKINEAGFLSSPISIGNNVWIGTKVTITQGVKIGNNSVIGANSVVTKDIPSNTVVAGVPAKFLYEL